MFYFYKMTELVLKTEDQAPIFAHLFTPEVSNGKVLLINSATGVKQQIYFSFSQFMAKYGFTVITYDYRGIGLSKPKKMKNYDASMRLWGSQDFKALTTFLKNEFPKYEKYCLGHSVGALILGMNEDAQIFKELIFVGTQNAYVGHLTFKTKIGGYIGFGIAQPITTSLLGYFPAHWFGLGESLPKNCANDWRSLILNRKSTNSLLEKIPDFSKKLTQKVLVIRAEDDTWLTEKGVRSLLEETYIHLKPTYRLVKTSESKKGEIGHINFFRSYNQQLWHIILEYIK